MPFLGKTPSQIVDPEVDIDGGTIDGVSIGSVTANAGAFTNLTATGTLTLPDDGISGDDVNGGTISNFASTGIDDNATSTAITIDASENFGIGTTSPSTFSGYTNFTLGGGSNGVNLDFKNSGGTRVHAIVSTGTEFITETGNTNPLVYKTNNIERMRIDSSGDVGIGLAPAFTAGGSRKLLQIANSTNGAQIAMSNSSSESENPRIFSDSTSLGFATAATGSGMFQFYTAGTERMRIDSSGNVDIYQGSNLNWRWQPADYIRGAISVDSSSNMTFTTAYTERMRIDSSGNVGIGTTSPSHNLDVTSSTASTAVSMRVGPTASIGDNDGTLIINNGGSGDAMLRFDYEGNADRARIGVTSSGQHLGFYTAGANERMRIDSSGNVGIGTNSPSSMLHLYGTDPILKFQDSLGGDTFGAYVSNLDGFGIYNFTDSRQDLTITGDGNVGIGTTSPFSTARLQVNTGTNRNLAVQTGTTETSGMKINAFNDAGTLNIPLELNGSVTLLKTGETERLRVDSSGNVGIGTTSPASELNVYHATDPEIRLTIATHGDAGVLLGDADGLKIYGKGNGNQMRFYTGTTERMRISSSGDVMVNVSSPSGGNGGTGAFHVRQDNTSSTTAPILASNEGGSGGLILFSGNGGGVGTSNRIYHGGSAVVYGTSSDERLKKNITPAPSALDVLHSVEAVSFDWKATDQHAKYGFIAQQFADVVPDAVIKGDTEEDHWGMDYGKVTPFLLKAIQEQQAIIEDLQTRLSALEAN